MLSSMGGQVNESRGVVAATKRLLLKHRDYTAPGETGYEVEDERALRERSSDRASCLYVLKVLLATTTPTRLLSALSRSHSGPGARWGSISNQAPSPS